MTDINLQLEGIVRKLAEIDPTNDESKCLLCEIYGGHKRDCPWQMAFDWALSHKPTPTEPCYRCPSPIGPNDLIDRLMIRGEEVTVHRKCPK